LPICAVCEIALLHHIIYTLLLHRLGLSCRSSIICVASASETLMLRGRSSFWNSPVIGELVQARTSIGTETNLLGYRSRPEQGVWYKSILEKLVRSPILSCAINFANHISWIIEGRFLHFFSYSCMNFILIYAYIF
jgi:hypothetical protein